MSNIFLCSDHHLGHKAIITFLDAEGKRFRLFDSIEEHDEYIIKQHNSVVSAKDRVYMLGDVTFSKEGLRLVGRMNGRKVLIKGNHDKLKLNDYLPYFDDIRGCHQFDGFFLGHVPIHIDSLGRWGHMIHGHLHTNRVRLPDGSIDERYISVCMEQLDDYIPRSLEDIKKMVGLKMDSR